MYWEMWAIALMGPLGMAAYSLALDRLLSRVNGNAEPLKSPTSN